MQDHSQHETREAQAVIDARVWQLCWLTAYVYAGGFFFDRVLGQWVDPEPQKGPTK